MREFLQFAGLLRDVGDVTESDDAANQFPVAVVQPLAIQRQDRVGLLGHPVDRNLVAELLAVTRPHQRQVGRVAIILAICVDATEHLRPRGVGLEPRSEAQDRAGRRIDIEHVAMLVDDDDAVVDVAQDRQHRNIGLGKARLQPMTLHGVLHDGFLPFHGNVVHADITLGARAHGGDTTVLPFPGGQSDDRVGFQQVDQFR